MACFYIANPPTIEVRDDVFIFRVEDENGFAFAASPNTVRQFVALGQEAIADYARAGSGRFETRHPDTGENGTH